MLTRILITIVTKLIGLKKLPTGVVDDLATKYHTKAIKIKVVIRPWAPAKPRSCYDNAFKYCVANPGTTYVVGYCVALGAVPIEHAWIKQGDKYFDITYKDTSKGDTYFSLYELDAIQLSTMGLKTSAAPGLYECAKYNVTPNFE